MGLGERPLKSTARDTVVCNGLIGGLGAVIAAGPQAGPVGGATAGFRRSLPAER